MSFFFSLHNFSYEERNVSIPLIYYNRHNASYVKDFLILFDFSQVPGKKGANDEFEIYETIYVLFWINTVSCMTQCN